MKKFCMAIFSLLVFMSPVLSQKTSGTVRGTLQDSLSASPLADATVSVVRLSDSSLISFSLTGPNGSFEIKNLDAGEYNLMSSFTGLQTLRRKFVISSQSPVADLGLLRMDRTYKALDEIVITEAPVKVNGDTIAYKADAFKTKPNATVEDLLKKLPGVQVERDGTVKTQGENVQKVYVDGKEFFSNDPKLATKNLTADMVDQVEVFDDMSEQAKFNRIDDGSRSKAINLKLKKDKKKGVFGKAYAGYGTKERFDMGLNANIFKGATQMSVIAKNNNTNNIGFTFSDMMGMFSGGGGMNMGGMNMGGMNVVRAGGGGGGGFGGLNIGGTGANGITKSSNVGFNYRDTWSKSFDVNGSYSFNHINTSNDRLSLRRTFIPPLFGRPEYTQLRNDTTISINENDNHRINWNMIYTVDSFNSIIYNPNVSYQKTFNTHSYSNYANDSLSSDGKRFRTNVGSSDNSNSGEGYNWSNNLTWRRKFRKAGRTLSATLNNTLGHNERESYVKVNSRFLTATGDLYRLINTDNINTTEGKTNNFGGTLSFTEAIARDKILEFNYSYNNNKNESDREIRRTNPISGKYEMADSNYFKNQNIFNRFGTNLRIVKKKYNYQLGFAFQNTLLQTENLYKKTMTKQRFTNLFPTASFNYQFARSRSLRFNYRGSTRQPSTNQLQDIRDTTNFPNIYEGNPNLGQEFSHNFTLSYNFFDIIRFRNLFAFLTFNTTNDKITNAIRQFPGGVQYTRPVNLDGAYSINGTINFGVPIKKLQGGNFNTNTRVTYSRDVNQINDTIGYTKNMNIGEDLRLSYNHKEKLDMGIGVSSSYTQSRFTGTNRQAQTDNSFFTHSFSADITYTLPKGFILSTDFDYTMYTGRTDGFNQNFALLNGSLAKEVFKNRRGEIKLSVYDILKQNIGITRNTYNNTIEDVQSSVLSRFFMLTLTYKLNRMGGRQMPAIMERATRGLRITQ